MSAENGDKIAVGLYGRVTILRGRGWTRDGGDLYETLDRLNKEGCARYVVTDIAKDGTLQGPNLELLTEIMLRRPDLKVQASGGVSSLEDLKAARAIGGQNPHMTIGEGDTNRADLLGARGRVARDKAGTIRQAIAFDDLHPGRLFKPVEQLDRQRGRAGKGAP